MKRRDAIKNTGLGFGFAFSSSALMTFLQGCNVDRSPAWTGEVLSAKQLELIASLGETVLPKTDTPGAAELLLERFFDKMLAGLFAEQDRAKFLSGLTELDQDCSQQMGKPFIELSVSDQQAFVTKLEAIPAPKANSLWGNALGKSEEVPFYRQFKGLLLWGYFSNEEVATNHMDYNPVPGKYQSCIPVTDETRIDPL